MSTSRPLTHWRTAGKYFSCGGDKTYWTGVTYGPFGPGEHQGGLGEVTQTLADLDAIAALGCNTIRLYHEPPGWFLEAAALRGLAPVISLPWADHVDFLRDARSRAATRQQLAKQASMLGRHACVAALLVGNEIPAPLVRWMGPRAVLQYLEELIDAVHQAAPETLASYATYPSSEYLLPSNADFLAFNVYLEQPDAYRRYLARLQNLAGDRPLVITEFGVDVQRLGADAQVEMLTWQHQINCDAGIAGNFVFSYTDEWFRGEPITDWSFGLVNAQRQPRPAYTTLQALGPLRPPDVSDAAPKFSVIVCTRNGSRTLEACLASLERLNYPHFEVILVNDGSTDATEAICKKFSNIRYLYQDPAGLSVARNTGAAAATGDILAYTDDDCVVDRDWLRYLSQAFENPKIAAAGGPNIPPAAENLAQACVIASPGGPAHVLMGDSVAEHIPGCNLAVRRSAFARIGGFLPKYHAAGDDVDFCWRLLERGLTIGFHAGAMVWHYRRFSVRDFLKQQRGYGKAEGLLLAQYGTRFGHVGGARWRGVVYQPSLIELARRAGRIYTGALGYAPFQVVYTGPVSITGAVLSSVPWLVLMATFLLGFFGSWHVGLLGVLMLAFTVLWPLYQAFLLTLPSAYRKRMARLLLWWLLLAQPIVRSVSRFYWGWRSGGMPAATGLGNLPLRFLKGEICFPGPELGLWSSNRLDRHTLLPKLQTLATQQGWKSQSDDGWRSWDTQWTTCPFFIVRFSSVTEYHQAPNTLTRLRLQVLLTRNGWLIFALCSIFCIFARIMALPATWGLFGALVLLSGIFYALRHTAHIRRKIAQTAQEAGFQVLS